MSWVPPDRPPETRPPEPHEPAPDHALPSGRRATTAIAAVAVGLVLVAGLVTSLLLRADGDGSPVAAPAATTSTAPERDRTDTGDGGGSAAPSAGAQAALEATVEELSQYVADARGAPFATPVEVELLAGDAFNRRLLADFEEQREDLELVGRLFVAVGLLEPDQDLFEIFRELLGAGVLGFYDPETGELVVRGADVTPATRSTIVHELVHAHDDQRFELHRPDLDEADDERGLGFAALVEGNATRVQRAWEAELGAAERAEILAEQLDGVDGLDVTAVPPVVLQQVQFPYTAGPDLVDALVEAGGEERVDAAFAEPPTTSEQVLDPDRYLAGEVARPVPAPAADGEVVDDGSYGQLTLLGTLADELDDETARRAAEGWGGDAYVAWRDGEATCVRAVFVMDTAEDLDELVDAWRRWADDHPDAEVVADEGAVTTTACA